MTRLETLIAGLKWQVGRQKIRRTAIPYGKETSGLATPLTITAGDLSLIIKTLVNCESVDDNVALLDLAEEILK